MSLSTLRGTTRAHSAKKHKIIVPIPLIRAEEKEYQQHQLLQYDLLTDPTDPDSVTYKFSMPYFKDGSAEEVIVAVQNFKKIIAGCNLNGGQYQYELARTVFKGSANAAFLRFAADRGAETPANLLECLNDLIEHILPKRALIYQKRAMRRFMRKPADMPIKDFMSRLTEINSYLEFFPPFEADQPLPPDELVDIGEFAIPLTWQKEMVLQGFEPAEHDTSDLVDFCDRFEGAEAFDEDKKSEAKRKSKDDGDVVPRKKSRRKNDDVWCDICKMNNHNTQDCNFLKKARSFKEANRSEKKRAWEEKKQSGQKPKEQMYTMKDVKSMMGKFSSRWRKAEKQKAKKQEELQNIKEDPDAEFFTSEDESNDDSSANQSVASVLNVTEADKDLIDEIFIE